MSTQKEAQISEKDAKFRDLVLHGNLWVVIFNVCLPLSLFQLFNHAFNILDTMMASHVSALAVSAVAYLSQIQSMISAVGVGLAAGSTLKISEAYGAGDFEMVKKRLSTLVTICFGLGALVLLCAQFTPVFLRFIGTPDEFIDIGTRYFVATLLSTVLGFFNNVYIAIERSRGNSKRILKLNTVVIFIKLSLTAGFIYGLKGGVTMIAVASVISQTFLFICATRNIFFSQGAFSFSKAYISFKKEVLAPMLLLSYPVIIEKVAFAFGKTVINSMSKNYGATTVGALGISNNINGCCTQMQNGFQDGGSAIISQLRGAGDVKRAIKVFWRVLIINMSLGLIMYILLNTFIWPISSIFARSANGFDYEFQKIIVAVFKAESIGGCIPLGVNAASMALFFGFGKTKLSLLSNFCRVFVFRIPMLWAFQHYSSMGSQAVGVVMALSNALTGLFAFILAMIVLWQEKKKLKN